MTLTRIFCAITRAVCWAPVVPTARTLSPPSSLTVFSTAAPEGDAGSMSELRFRVVMTAPQPQPVRIDYTTSPGTATAGTDYLATAEMSRSPPVKPRHLSSSNCWEIVTKRRPRSFPWTLSPPITRQPRRQVTGTIANDDTSCDTPFTKEPNPWLVNGADPLNFAHRGGVTDFPENTLYAYAQAALAGADVLEMDVYQTKDKELVILHDLDVDRTTNGTGKVVDLTLAELRALDAAYWFVPVPVRRMTDPEAGL